LEEDIVEIVVVGWMDVVVELEGVVWVMGVIVGVVFE